MAGFQFTITDAGRAALIAAGNTGTNAVQITQVGLTQSGFVPAAGMTALPDEFGRLVTFAGQAVASDTIHLTVRDEGPAVYDLRGFALYLANGTLFGLYGQVAPIVQKAATAIMLLALDIVLSTPNAAAISFGPTGFLNPPGTETVPGVVTFATPAEAAAGGATSKAVTPAGMKPLLDAKVKIVNPDGSPHAISLGWNGTRFQAGVDNNNVSQVLATSDDIAGVLAALGRKVRLFNPDGNPHDVTLGWTGARLRSLIDTTGATIDLVGLNDFAQTYVSPGWMRLPSGLIVQWVRNWAALCDANGDCQLRIVFPISFTGAVLGFSYCNTNEAPPAQAPVQMCVGPPSLVDQTITLKSAGGVWVAVSGLVVGY